MQLSEPAETLEVVRFLADGTLPALLAVTERLDHAIADDRRLGADVDRIAVDANLAQAAFANWTDLRVDGMLLDLAREFDGAAERLARRTVMETEMGNVRDNTLKNRFASMGVYDSLAGKTAAGVLAVDPNRRVTELASPVRVVFGIVPITNPVATATFKTQCPESHEPVAEAGAGRWRRSYRDHPHHGRRARRAIARAMPAGRILVNSPAAQGCCGITTGLECSMTLGCGTFGGSSTTDNVTYRHLLNVTRIAHDLRQGEAKVRIRYIGDSCRSKPALTSMENDSSTPRAPQRSR